MDKPGFLEKLLDGAEVAWRPLGELGELVRGNGLPKKDFVEAGVPAIHYGQIYTYYGLTTTSTLSFVSPKTAETLKKVNPGDVVITNTSENFEDVATPLVYLGEKQAVTGGHATIFKPGQSVLSMYFAYFTQTPCFEKAKRQYAKGAKVIDVPAKDMSKILIPIPCPDDRERSLAIQAEIVRILDTFTELTARKKQYNYYRDKLLSFDEHTPSASKEARKQGSKEARIRWMALGEVATIFAGGDLPENFNKGQITPSVEFPYPIYSNGSDDRALYGYSNTYKVDADAVTVSARGTIGFHAVRRGKFTPIVRLITLIPNQAELTAEFLDYVLNITKIGHSGGSIPQLTVPSITKIRIPIPPLEEQARIVSILDKFDALTHSISDGLPREIELRTKQYEYYRDVLLNFPKLEKAA